MNEQLAELISEFRRELPRRVEEIASILAQLASDLLNQDLIKHAHRLVHNLVGSCNAFGAEYVATSAKGMEVYFRDRMEEESVLTSEDIANLKHMTGLLTTLSKQWIESNAPQAYKQVKSVYKKESLVYIVEDDEAVQLALVSYLINSGYKIETFTNLNEFTQKIRDFVPCAIIMDMIFAEGDNAGAEIISELSKEIEPFPPVIFISTRGDMNARLQADKAGASRYFTKPVDEKKLIHTLDRLTNRIETHPYRVLVVDDDRLQAEYYANSLTEAGIEAKVLTEPLKVLSELASFKPDLLVSDVYMDSCSGLQLAKVIRQDDDYTNMPIVFLSSEERLDKQLVAMDLGGDDFLTKPVEPDHLVSALLARLKRARWISDIYLNLQEALNESEYRRVALDRHSIVSITDVSGTITSANEKFSEISGYSLPELIGQNHRLLNSSYHPKSFFKTMWETISSGKVWHGEICNRKKSGELYWVESTIVPFLDSNGLPYKYVSVRTDITNIKQSEEALRESKTLLQTVINNIPAGIYWIDRGGVILGCNTAFLRDMGVSKKNEILGFKWTEIAWKIREAAAFHTLDLEAMITGVASLNVEGLLSTATGFRKWIDLNRIPLRGQNGDVIGVLVAYEDVSSYKNYEHELIAARDMADAANRTKSEFLSQMSHELRTPLNAILGFSQILEMEEITQDQKEWVNEIVLAGRHLLELINDILDLAKVEAGRLTLEIGNVELWEVVLESVSLIQTQLDINHIDLEVKLGDKVLALGSEEEPPPIYLRSDRIRVKQVLLNFLSNAIKYNKKQGSIRIEVHKLGANIRVAITDTGIGIAENKQNMVFSSFNRLGVESTEIEGTGIGLVISKNLIELLGGKIGFSSIENKGSTFWFELPLAMHQASDASENAGGAALEGCAFQVLYIEDGLESLKAVAELFLHESQIKLLTSSTIEEGVKLLSKQSPDLILIEMTNREEECAQLLGFLQDTPSLAEIPVLAIMSDASDQARNKCLQIGFADIIVKPFDTQAINEALTHFLTRR